MDAYSYSFSFKEMLGAWMYKKDIQTPQAFPEYEHNQTTRRVVIESLKLQYNLWKLLTRVKISSASFFLWHKVLNPDGYYGVKSLVIWQPIPQIRSIKDTIPKSETRGALE